VAAERIVWNGEAVGTQITGLRSALTRSLDDAMTNLKRAQLILRRNDVPVAITRSLDAQLRRLEGIQERTRVLWRRVQTARETMDRAESKLAALASELARGGDTVAWLPVLPSVKIVKPVKQPVPHTPPNTPMLPFVIKPLPGMDAWLAGRTVIDTVSGGAAWVAPQCIIPPWLAEMLNT